MIRPLRLYGDPILRRKAAPVTKFGPELAGFVQDMRESLDEHGGVGLAAPQLGVPSRVFIAQELGHDEEGESFVVHEHVMINPQVSRTGGEQIVPEGCLSLPGLFVDDLNRFESLHVRFQDEHGDWQVLSAAGHFAQVIQHENDHLNGLLFLDRLPTRQRHEFMKEHRAELVDMQLEAREFLRNLKRHKLAQTR